MTFFLLLISASIYPLLLLHRLPYIPRIMSFSLFACCFISHAATCCQIFTQRDWRGGPGISMAFRVSILAFSLHSQAAARNFGISRALMSLNNSFYPSSKAFESLF
ncbi:hypothetical protein IWX47DRAFT_598064 [Phyllosticta citricarpa]